MSKASMSRGKIIGIAAGIFIISLLLYTAIGLALIEDGDRNWIHLAQLDGNIKGVPFRAGDMRIWQNYSAPLPKHLEWFKDRDVTCYGYVRRVPNQDSFWLVADQISITTKDTPPINSSIWIDMIQAPEALAKLPNGMMLRAEGVIKMKYRDQKGVGMIAYELELARLARRDPNAKTSKHQHSESCNH